MLILKNRMSGVCLRRAGEPRASRKPGSRHVTKAALLLRVDHELPYEEIAAALGTSVTAAKVMVHRARLRLTSAWRLSPDAERRLLDEARDRARRKLFVIGGATALAGFIALIALGGAIMLMFRAHG